MLKPLFTLNIKLLCCSYVIYLNMLYCWPTNTRMVASADVCRKSQSSNKQRAAWQFKHFKESLNTGGEPHRWDTSIQGPIHGKDQKMISSASSLSVNLFIWLINFFEMSGSLTVNSKSRWLPLWLSALVTWEYILVLRKGIKVRSPAVTLLSVHATAGPVC